MTRTLTLPVCLGVAMGGAAVGAGPQISVGPAYRFAGTHLQHETFEIRVPVANRGDAPLVVHEVTTDCNCVTGTVDRSSLDPQSETTLHIRAETRDFLGRLRREVRIASDDPNTPSTRLVLEYDVVRPITLAPAALHLGVVRPGQRVMRTVAIRVRGDDSLRPLYATVSDPTVRVELPEETVTSRAPAEIFVTVEVPETVGPLAATVTIHTDSRTQPKLSLAIRGSVSDEVTLSAPRFELGSFTAAAPSGSELTVQCGPSSRVKAVSVSSKGLRVERRDIDGKTTLKLLPTRRLRIGTVSAALRIETTGKEEQTIVVPVRGTLTAR